MSSAASLKLIAETAAEQGIIDISTLSNLSRSGFRDYLSQNQSSVNDEVLTRIWDRLIFTAGNPAVTEKHLTSACNAVSVFLISSSSSSSHVHQVIFSEIAWFHAYGIVQRTLSNGKAKPALQILETLVQILQNHYEPVKQLEILSKITIPILTTILTAQPQAQLKDACVLLSCLLKKTPLMVNLQSFLKLTLEQRKSLWISRLRLFNVGFAELRGDHLETLSLILAVTFATIKIDTRSASLKLLSLLCGLKDQHGNSPFYSKVQGAIELFLNKNEDVLGEFAESVFPVIFNDLVLFKAFQHRLSDSIKNKTTRPAVFLALLKVGRLKKFITSEDLLWILNDAFVGIRSVEPSDNYYIFKQLLAAQHFEIRLSTYDLLTTSSMGSAAVSIPVLHCLTSCLKYIHDDADAHDRGEILSVTRRLIRRLERSSLILHNSTKSTQIDQESSIILSEYDDFMQRFTRFLTAELSPAISYPRHILALQTLQLSMGLIFKHSTRLLDSLIRALLNLIMDPFEDVRSISANLLKMISREYPSLVSPVVSKQLAYKFESISAITARHDHADATGRLWEVLSCLRVADNTLEHSLPDLESSASTSHKIIERLVLYIKSAADLRPSSPFPLHGLLLALKYSLLITDEEQNWRLEQTDALRILDASRSIWEHVQTQLCVDSPETATDEHDLDENTGPKDHLAYAWRALRDSSLVIQSVLHSASENLELYRQAGNLCMQQLISLRHRGAFSTVAQTFNICCERVREASNDGLPSLTSIWYREALAEIEKQAQKLTRRSAGLPAMLMAILNPRNAIEVTRTIQDLIRIAEIPVEHDEAIDEEPRLPQVHALNCIKDIMTNSRFRLRTEEHLGSILELAARDLSSETWAIRNCGLMLLKACINRLDPKELNFNDEDASPSRSGHQIPLQIAVDLLTETQNFNCRKDCESIANNVFSESPSASSEKTFAALDLLSHLDARLLQTPPIKSMIQYQLCSPIWSVREHAARLLSSLIENDPMDMDLDSIKFFEDLKTTSNNEIHGNLLYCRYALQAAWKKGESFHLQQNIDKMINILVSKIALFISQANHYIISAVLDILNDIKIEYSPLEITAFNINALLSQLITFSTSHRLNDHSHCFSRILLASALISISSSHNKSEKVGIHIEVIRFRLAADNNATKYLIENLMRIENKEFSAAIIDLLIDVIHQSSAGDVTTLAIKGLCAYLESSEENLTDAQRSSLSGKVNFQSSCNKKEWIADLRLHAHLVVASDFDPSNSDVFSFQKELADWIRTLQLAAADELDVSIRLEAVAALSIYSKLFRRLRMLDLHDDSSLQILLILYDLLNDDDEDVRNNAVFAATDMLSELSNQPFDICPLAIRELLISIVFPKYQENTRLAHIALSRVFGDYNSHASSFGMQAPHYAYSFADRLKRILIDASDLFAEEKQNLYVDELKDLQHWSDLLGRSSKPIGADATLRVESWILQGIDDIMYLVTYHNARPGAGNGIEEIDQRILDMLEPYDRVHPLNPTYDTEILILTMRLISLAKIFAVQTNDNNFEGTGNDTSENQTHIKIRLKELKVAFSADDVHEWLRVALE